MGAMTWLCYTQNYVLIMLNCILMKTVNLHLKYLKVSNVQTNFNTLDSLLIFKYNIYTNLTDCSSFFFPLIARLPLPPLLPALPPLLGGVGGGGGEGEITSTSSDFFGVFLFEEKYVKHV